MKFSRRFRNISTVLAVAISLLSLSACSAGSGQADAACKKTITFGFSHTDTESAYVSGFFNAIKRKAAADKCLKALFDNTQNANLQNQVSTVQGWITQKVDAIVIIPVDPNALEGLRKKAQAQGIKWINYAAKLKGADGSIGFDNAASGKLCGQAVVNWTKEHFPNGNVSAAITTSLLPLWAPRNTDAKKVLDAASIPIVSYLDCNTQACGLQITQNTLREHPELRLFIGNNDDAGLGAARAFQSSGIDVSNVFIVGQDGGPQALATMKKGGPFRATVAISVDDLAATTIKTVKNAVNGSGETDNITPVTLVTQSETAKIDKLIAQFK